MPQRDAERKPAGSADIGIVFPGVLLVAALLSRHSLVAERIWHKLGSYPDIVACREAAVIASWPLRPWAMALLDHAEQAAWAAKAVLAHEASVAAFVKAQTLVTGSRLLLELPAFLLIAAGGVALGRIIARFERPASLDLSERLVLLDTSNLGPPTFELPEFDLPFPPAVASREGWTGEDIADYHPMLELAATDGLGCPAISRTLAAMPVARASKLRAALRVEAGLSDIDLAAYRQGHLWRPRHWRLRRLRKAGVSVRFLEAREALRRIGGLTPLRERLLGIAAAHAAWPASIDHHGAAEGGLLDHRASILLETVEQVRAGRIPGQDREALLTATAAHDAGKWISFGRDGGRWIRFDGLHAQRTAAILRSLPELDEMDATDAVRVCLALEQEHSPAGLPDDFRTACLRLLRPIKAIERVVVDAEEDAELTVDRAVQDVIGVLPRMVSEMSINRVAGDWQAHGFYEGQCERGEEVLLLLEAALRNQLRDYIGQPAQRALGLWRDRRAGELHPGFAAIARGLLAVGAIPGKVRRTPITAAMPLVSLKAGKKVFRGAFPVSLAWLARKIEPESLVHLKDGWSARAWDITILGQGVDVPAALPQPPQPKPAQPAKPGPKPPEPPSGGDVAGEPSRGKPADAGTKPASEARCPACHRPMRLVRKGILLICTGSFQKTCDAKLRVSGGQAITTCLRCGKELVPLRLGARPAFMACPDTSCKRKPTSNDGQDKEPGSDA